MKAKILSLAFALIALFAFNNVFASNPQWVQDPCFSGSRVYGKLAGLGNNALLTIKLEGYATCTQNNGVPTNTFFSKNIKVRTDKNGSYDLNGLTVSVCNRNWSGSITSLTICVYDGSKTNGQSAELLVECTPAYSCS